MCRLVCCLAIGTFLCTDGALGETPGEPVFKVEGQVTTMSGGFVQAVSVTLHEVRTGSDRIASTGADGKFTFLAVRGGKYVLAARANDLETNSSEFDLHGDIVIYMILRPSAPESEVALLREQVDDLQRQVSRLQLSTGQKAEQGRPVPPAENAGEAPQTAQQNLPPKEQGRPQSTGLPTDPNLALAVKAQGGDLSGAGNLYRNDRLAIGGYGDFQFREPGLNEKNDGGGTSTFQSTRFVVGLAAVLSQRQNIVFNSEIEYEFGARELDIEQAFVEWKVRPTFSFRGGIYPPSLGHFNTYHDSNLNLTTLRPLINQFIINTAYRDAGIGTRGVLNMPKNMKMSYEFNLLNGMQPLDAGGLPTPFSRLLGQASASEPGLIGFQAVTNRKAVSGRIGFSPILGFEIGGSVYNGPISALGQPPQSVTIAFYDASYRRGRLAIDAEYARSNIVGGIPRRSSPPPVVDPLYPDTAVSLAKYVAALSPGQDGTYAEVAYNLTPGFFQRHFDEGSYIAPVVRFESVRRDRTLPNFYLNESRTTVGLNVAPSLSTIFKFNYVFNHPFGPVPQTQGPVGGADFGNNPIPFLSYGKNGFVGSVAYVF
jgi:hypothetical protein